MTRIWWVVILKVGTGLDQPKQKKYNPILVCGMQFGVALIYTHFGHHSAQKDSAG
jgi:hypothetical protein